MNTSTIYNELNKTKKLYMNGDNKKAAEVFDSLLNKLYLEELNKEVKGSRKKAIKKIQSLSKKIGKNRPVLSLQKRIEHNNVDGYVFTDSYFLTFTKDKFLKVFDDLNKEELQEMNINGLYPDVKRIINIDDCYFCNIDNIDFKEVQAITKLKKDDEDRFSKLTFNDNKSKSTFDRWVNSDYLMIVYNLLVEEKNKNDIVVYTATQKKFTPVVFKNTITEEFVLIMPIRKAA